MVNLSAPRAMRVMRVRLSFRYHWAAHKQQDIAGEVLRNKGVTERVATAGWTNYGDFAERISVRR